MQVGIQLELMNFVQCLIVDDDSNIEVENQNQEKVVGCGLWVVSCE